MQPITIGGGGIKCYIILLLCSVNENRLFGYNFISGVVTAVVLANN